MGKQVNFFMCVDDEELFLEGIKTIAPYGLLQNTFASTAEMGIERLPACIAKQSIYYICRSDIRPRIRTEHIPEQNYYCIDFIASEVVQFTRCHLEHDRLFRGRLWFEPTTERAEKRKQFVGWANALLGWIKKNFERRGAYYVGPVAAEKADKKQIQLGPDIFREMSGR